MSGSDAKVYSLGNGANGEIRLHPVPHSKGWIAIVNRSDVVLEVTATGQPGGSSMVIPPGETVETNNHHFSVKPAA